MRSEVAWTARQWPAVEHVAVTVDIDGWTADGAMVGVLDGAAVRLTYRLRVDGDGATRALDIADSVGGASVSLRTDGQGRWWGADGTARPDLKGCIDVDISTTPLTNTLPVRRLGLAPGESAEIHVGYVDVPSLNISATSQRYTRIDRQTYRYTSGSFAANVIFDDDDLVTDYVDFWQRVPIEHPGKTKTTCGWYQDQGHDVYRPDP